MKDMANLRKELDKLNIMLVDILEKRSDIVKSIAKIKKEQNLPVYDPFREEKILEKIQTLAKDKNVNPGLAAALMKVILQFSKKEMQEFIDTHG